MTEVGLHEAGGGPDIKGKSHDHHSGWQKGTDMATDIGEYIVGAYLKLITGCNVIDYNVRGAAAVRFIPWLGT